MNTRPILAVTGITLMAVGLTLVLSSGWPVLVAGALIWIAA